MNIDNLSDLPDWDESHFNEEGEGLKASVTREAGKTLYLKWREIVTMLNGALNFDRPTTGKISDDYITELSQMVLNNAYEVGAKIIGAEAGGMYVIRMQNAAFVREYAQFISSSILLLSTDCIMEDNYAALIREELARFRELFRTWVNSFEKDEFIDEWGLFI